MSGSTRSPTGQTYRTIGIALLILAALGLVILGARGGPDEFEPIPTAANTATATLTPDESRDLAQDPPEEITNADADLLLYKIMFWVLLATILAGAVVLVMMFPRFRSIAFRRWRFHTRADGFAGSDVGDELSVAVDEGLRAMDEGTPSEAIIACWMRLEEAVARAGTVRRPHETSAELTTRVLAAHAVSTQPLFRLADLYREARFSGHRMTESDRSEARATLDRLRSELTGRVGGGAR